MQQDNKNRSQELAEHFFRNQYGKMVAVITRYIGTGNVETAEDIVQQTLLKAVEYWQHKGIPDNPEAWLYTTAKNLTLNKIKRSKRLLDYKNKGKGQQQKSDQWEEILVSERGIADQQLKMMFVCCHPSISEKSQIALMLKILCGFSIAEIASAFFTSNETINKRLVRGRKQLGKEQVNFELPDNLDSRLQIVIKTIYLLFNEGYNPSVKNELIRFDLCLEAIRLTKLLVESPAVKGKTDCFALLALMSLNAARFGSRINPTNNVVELDEQDRSLWNQDLINSGIQYLNLAASEKQVSAYLILATISANHCIAPSFEKTNWEEILSLYDNLLQLNDRSVVRLNRSVALARVKGNGAAILELKRLAKESDLNQNHLFHSTLAELYKLENETDQAINHYKKAISLTINERDQILLEKKLTELVPFS